MLKVKAVNQLNQELKLYDNTNYALTSVDGILPPKANVNTAALATKDGSVFNSARLNNRNVVLTVYPLGAIETNRMALYSFFKAKKPVRLYLATKSRSAYVDGWVESVSGSLFDQKEKLQVSVICPDPWLKAVTPVVQAFDALTHAATVTNNSDDETGFVCEFTASGAVTLFRASVTVPPPLPGIPVRPHTRGLSSRGNEHPFPSYPSRSRGRPRLRRPFSLPWIHMPGSRFPKRKPAPRAASL